MNPWNNYFLTYIFHIFGKNILKALSVKILHIIDKIYKSNKVG